MRTRVTAITVCCILLLAACTKQQEPAPTSNYVHAPSASEFRTIAKYSTLGEIWSDVGGVSAIKAIHTDSEGHRALFELKGQGNTALWLDFSQGRQLEKLELGMPIVGADLNRQSVYLHSFSAQHQDYIQGLLDGLSDEHGESGIKPGAGIDYETIGYAPDASLVAERLPSLPAGKAWSHRYFGGEILSVSTHPQAGSWWFAVAQFLPHDGEVADNGSVILFKADGAEKPEITSITCENISPDCKTVCLADGSLLLNSGGFLYIANGTGGQPRKIFAIPDGREAQVFADTAMGNLAWVFLKPKSSGGGTGREKIAALPGKLVCIDQAGQQQASIETGSVPFSDMVGDYTKRRCLLLQDSVGIALADLRQGTFSWPLRVRDDIALFLLPNASEAWALLPDAIVGIGLDELVELGPKLAADKVIEGELADELRPAVAALGWDWAEVQVSPLMSQTGKLTLFDTSDPDSTWSQLDWSTAKHRCTGLLIARKPTLGDLGVLEMSPAPITGWCRSVLWALGWNQSTLVDSNRDKYEAHFTYALVPRAKPPLTSGEYQVWITETAAYYSLEGATFEFPSGSISISEARLVAAQKYAEAAGIGTGGLLVSNLPQAGWLLREGGGWRFLHEATEGAKPCFRLEALREGKSAGLFVVYLDALDGEVLYQVEDRFSPLANLGVLGGKYSKVVDE